MTQGRMPETEMPAKVKPAIPQKPPHLIKAAGAALLKKNNQLLQSERRWDRWGTTKAAAASGFGNQFKKNQCPRAKNVANKNYHRACESTANLSTRPCDKRNCAGFPSSKTQSFTLQGLDNSDEYVQINCPCVEPGTIVRSADISNDQRISNSEDCTRDRNKLAHRSLSEGLGMFHLIKCFPNDDQAFNSKLQYPQSNSGIYSNEISKPPNSTAENSVDENGYEIPIRLQSPVYISFDDDLITSSADETDAPEHNKRPVVISRQKKKRRLARYKRGTSAQQIHAATLINNLSKSFVLRSAVGQSHETNNAKEVEHDQPLAKPVNSFLSNRLQKVQSETYVCMHKCVTPVTSGSGISTTYSNSSSEDEWSFSSDYYSSDEECYYQQIDPPQMPQNVTDHDYEVIEECMGWMQKSQDAWRKKSIISVMASVVHGRGQEKEVKPEQTIKLPTEASNIRKIQRQHMHEMRSTRIEDCTWATVSTPGILKLEHFKDFGKAKNSTVEATAVY